MSEANKQAESGSGSSACSLPLRYRSNNGTEANDRDTVYTPDHIAKQIIDRYGPSGRILDPCRGDGAFWRQIQGAEWCEVSEGRDFFEWTQPADWIIGNPPFSIMNRWLEHSMKIGENIVYLLPTAKLFGSRKRLRAICEFGLREVWSPWTGRAIGFEFGWACGCVHLQRGWQGDVKIACD